MYKVCGLGHVHCRMMSNRCVCVVSMKRVWFGTYPQQTGDGYEASLVNICCGLEHVHSGLVMKH